MKNVLDYIGRKKEIFNIDVLENDEKISEEISSSTFLVIGGGGSIGQSITKEIFKRDPIKLHIVDINENSLVELVRDVRSSYGYIKGDFRTFAIDCGTDDFSIMFEFEGPYDYVLNLSALKHVRSERDPWTLMRMIQVNILNTLNTIDLAVKNGCRKYFCISTDKAANPANMMGASKRIMEMFLTKKGEKISISTARFANVAFSDGSLLHVVRQRIVKGQPIAAPSDIRRYFVTPEESGRLCLLSTILGNNQEILFPKINNELSLITFKKVITSYLKSLGYAPLICNNENEARKIAESGTSPGSWPCYFARSDTTGEKSFEEFYTREEDVDLERYKEVGVLKNSISVNEKLLSFFLRDLDRLREKRFWTREDIIDLFGKMIPEFRHLEKNRFLDQKM